MVANADLRGVTAIRLETLADPSLPLGGAGRSADGKFVLTEFEVPAAPAGAPTASKPVRFSSSVAEYEQKNSEIGKAVDGNPATGWSTGDLREASRVDRQAIFVLEHALSSEAGTQLTIRLRQDSDRPNAAIGRFRLSATTTAAPTQVKLPLEIERILALESERRTPEQKALIAQYYRSIAPELEQLRTQLSQLREGWEQATSPTTLVMNELNEPRKTQVFIRGSFQERKGSGTGVPAVLHPLKAGRHPIGLLLQDGWSIPKTRWWAGSLPIASGWTTSDGPVAAHEDFGNRGVPLPIPNCWIG